MSLIHVPLFILLPIYSFINYVKKQLHSQRGRSLILVSFCMCEKSCLKWELNLINCLKCCDLEATLAATCITVPNLRLNCRWLSWIVGKIGTRFYQARMRGIKIYLVLLHQI